MSHGGIYNVHPSHSDRHGGLKHGYYNLCRSLIRLLAEGDRKRLEAELHGNDAQLMVDFLSQILDDDQSDLTKRERKYVLHSLAKLSKTAQVFPHSLEIGGIQCDLTRRISEGGYGFIYKGYDYKGRSLCVKAVQTSTEGTNSRKLRAQAGELILWAHSSHPNVLPFAGIFFSGESIPRVCIVSPWMENGDLSQYLRVNHHVPYTLLVHDIIKGLRYLHDFDLVHNDLKAANILVSQEGRAMLADFGISRVMLTRASTTKAVVSGTAYWSAPEMFSDDEPRPTFESDIWSLGCVFYEMITGKMPFHEYRVDANLIYAFLMNDKLIPTRPAALDHAKQQIWSVAELCWKRDPRHRPRAEELQGLVERLGLSDSRQPGSRYPRPRTDVAVDHFRTFQLLYSIRNTLTANSDHTLATRFMGELVKQIDSIHQRHGH